MCIAAWIWQSHPVYQLLLLFNRDEFHNRPTQPLGWWERGGKGILGGRDGLAGGTWSGATKDGKLAFLTNFREPDPSPAKKSRGDLPVRFLESTKSPYSFAEEIVDEANQYNGFNLVLVDLCLKSMVYISNRPKGEPISVHVVPAGLHVLSNANLNSPWPKAQGLSKKFSELLTRHGEKEINAKEAIEEVMLDNVKADRDKLPLTGCDPDWEFELSSIFIDVNTERGRYGTRSIAAVSVDTSGESTFHERYLENGLWKEHSLQYHIEEPQQCEM